MNIVILDSIGLNPGDLSFKDLEKYGNLTVYEKTETDEDIIKRAKDADAIFIVYININEKILKNLPKLKYIGVLSTGYDSIDLDLCKEYGIVVTNVPSYGSRVVAQHALALLLEITTRIGHHDKEVKNGRWQKEGFWHFGDYTLVELYQKTVGIIGLGEIGLEAAKIYKALGMKVLAYNRSKNKYALEYIEYVDLDYLYENSDIIDLHLPLTKDTYDFVDKKSIEKMKDGVIIINTARGGLINEYDLRNGIDNGKIYAAGLDVVKNEPIQNDDPLLGYDNIIITPHMAWGPKETRKRLLDIAIKNFKGYLEGEDNINRLN